MRKSRWRPASRDGDDISWAGHVAKTKTRCDKLGFLLFMSSHQQLIKRARGPVQNQGWTKPQS